MTPHDFNEIIRLAGLLATARCRRLAYQLGRARSESLEGIERRIGNAERNLKDYLCGLVNENRAEQVAKLQRQQEIIADIGFDVGSWWRNEHTSVCGRIMDAVDGSRGLMELIIDKAEEFDAFWESLPVNDPRRERYIEEVGKASEALINELKVMK